MTIKSRLFVKRLKSAIRKLKLKEQQSNNKHAGEPAKEDSANTDSLKATQASTLQGKKRLLIVQVDKQGRRIRSGTATVPVTFLKNSSTQPNEEPQSPRR